MKAILFNMLIVLMVFPTLSQKNDNSLTGKYTKTKKISKTYKVKSDALLHIANSYGNIDVTSWNQNTIEIDVYVKTNGNDEEKVVKALNAIEIAFEASPSRVSAETIFEEENSSWWNIFGSSSNVNREINYVIKMPVTNHADFNNDYGAININKLKGDVHINCDYGKLIIGELLSENNVLNFDYTRNSVIDYVKKAKINADYSGFEIKEAGAIDLNADYTSSKINKVTSLNFNCDYGSVEVGKVQHMKGIGDYLGTEIGEVHGNLTLDLDYGSASIGKLTKDTKNVKIESDYTGIDIGYDADLPFSFDLETSYGDIDGLNNFNITSSSTDSFENGYEGYNVSPNSGNKVFINTDYGSINFNRK